MRFKVAGVLAAAAIVFSGCVSFDRGSSQVKNSSSLVNFLYPNGKMPPLENTIPELRIPLRVGLAFLPPQANNSAGLSAAEREQLLERVRQRFADRKFVTEIVTVPDYYLRTAQGYEGLQGVQRLYNVDVMALISYDQLSHQEDNAWSLGYVTIVGAYVLKGSRHDVSTLVDLAVVDPQSRSLVLRAGGTDTRHGNTTLIDRQREARSTSTESFSAATDVMIENFEAALKKFEADVKAGKSHVKIVNRNAQRSSGNGGGGALELPLLLGLFAFSIIRRKRGHTHA